MVRTRQAHGRILRMWDSERSALAQSLLSSSSEGFSVREIIGPPLSVVVVRGLCDAAFCHRLEADVMPLLPLPSACPVALTSQAAPGAAGIRSGHDKRRSGCGLSARSARDVAGRRIRMDQPSPVDPIQMRARACRLLPCRSHTLSELSPMSRARAHVRPNFV